MTLSDPILTTSLSKIEAQYRPLINSANQLLAATLVTAVAIGIFAGLNALGFISINTLYLYCPLIAVGTGALVVGGLYFYVQSKLNDVKYQHAYDHYPTPPPFQFEKKGPLTQLMEIENSDEALEELPDPIEDRNIELEIEPFQNTYESRLELAKELLLGALVIACICALLFGLGGLPLDPIYLYTTLSFVLSSFAVGSLLYLHAKKNIDKKI